MSKEITFGLHMIVRDAVDNIYHIHDAVIDYFDKIVIVDTGSVDGTWEKLQELAEKYPDVYVIEQREWGMHFAEARNAALSLLDTDVFMWLDSDDVIPENSPEGWRKLAEQLYEDYQNGKKYHIMLPYHYLVDEDTGNVLTTQYRERICVDPRSWVWRGRIHELLRWVGSDNEMDVPPVVVDQYEIKHKAARVEHRKDRNFNLVHLDLFNDINNIHSVDSLRTAYYAIIEAVQREQFEYAIILGKVCINAFNKIPNKTTFYYLYEMRKRVGEAFNGLYNRVGDKSYLRQAIPYLEDAIKQTPTRNEARVVLTDVLAKLGRIEDAIEQVREFNTTIPRTIIAVDTGYYTESFQNAFLAKLMLLLAENDPIQFINAVHHHVESLDHTDVSELCFMNHQTIMHKMKSEQIGVIFVEDTIKYRVPIARYFRDWVVKKGLANEVVVTTDPRLSQLASNIYVHIGNRPENLYLEEVDHRINRIHVAVIQDDDHENLLPEGDKFGFDRTFTVDDNYFNEQGVLSIKEEVLQKSLDQLVDYKIATIHASTIEDGLNKARAIKPFGSFSGFVVINLTEDHGSNYDYCVDFDKSCVKLFVEHDTKRLLRIVGHVDRLNSLKAELNTVYTKTLGIFDFVDEFPHHGEDLGGIKYEVILPNIDNPKSIAIVAPGVEEWDGTTVYKTGIGASETSVAYLAEWLSAMGHSVHVFTTVKSDRVIGLVNYHSIEDFERYVKNWDLLISSRLPSVLKVRRAKKQVLWMHDVPHAYAELKDQIIADKFVAVSDDSYTDALDKGFDRNKLIAIANALNQYVPRFDSVDVVKKRAVWVSQPERGLKNLIDIVKEYREQHEGEELEVAYVYGHYNYINFSKNSPKAFREVQILKSLCRENQIKIMGRLNYEDVRRLMWSSYYWLYPTDFQETFCVSALEAAQASLRMVVQDYGAVSDTLEKYTNAAVRYVGKGYPYLPDYHKKMWLEEIEDVTNVPLNDQPLKSKPSCHWADRAEVWAREFLK